MKKIVLLGASGSVGNQTLDVLLQHSDLYEIVGLSVGSNISYMKDYLNSHSLKYASVEAKADYEVLKELYPETNFYYGVDGLNTLAAIGESDLVINCLQGFVGLFPTLTAIEAKKNVACANKESLIAAGELVMQKAKENGVTIIPVDSEHSAIFQTLQGNKIEDVSKLIITASGGAFRNKSREELEDVTLAEALMHPKWNMGDKITIDSATMMNKGFEVIEAHVLFGIPYQQIEVLLHPETVVHSLTQFKDNSILAQLAVSDMRIPVQFALTYPDRIENTSNELDLAQIGSLHFERMDEERFPLLRLAYDVGQIGGNLLAVLNGANEEAVELFLKGEISFMDIETLIFECIDQFKENVVAKPTLQQIIDANDWAVKKVHELVEEAE